MEHFTTQSFIAKYILHRATLHVQYDQLNDESIRSFLRRGKEKISTERTFVVLMYLQVRVL